MVFEGIEEWQNSAFHWLYNRFLKLIIYPSIWVAAAIASLGKYFQTVLELGHNWQAIALIFVTAIIPYNLDRIFDSYVQTIPDSKVQLFFRQPYVWLVLSSAIASTVYLLYNAPTNVRYVSVAGIVPLLYGTPVFPWKQEKQWRWYRLKDLPGSKAWIVGLTLTYAVVALPLAYSGRSLRFNTIIITLFLFVFIVTNSHIFDVRDLESDRQKGVVTLPITIGIKGTKIFLTMMNLSIMLTIAIAWINNTIAPHPEMLVALGINLAYVWLVDSHTPRWVYGILIEGCLFIPFLGQWAIAAIV